VLDIDVKGYFDSIDWELMLKAVRRHADCGWVLLHGKFDGVAPPTA
jgi:RNA-directed DNA polymerase